MTSYIGNPTGYFECHALAMLMAKAAETYLGIDVTARSRRTDVIRVRRAIILALREERFSSPAIAQAGIGVTDHSTVLHHLEAAEQMRDIKNLARALHQAAAGSYTALHEFAEAIERKRVSAEAKRVEKRLAKDLARDARRNAMVAARERGETYRAIGEQHGLSHEMVRRIIAEKVMAHD